jgi:hypothetical protein
MFVEGTDSSNNRALKKNVRLCSLGDGQHHTVTHSRLTAGASILC